MDEAVCDCDCEGAACGAAAYYPLFGIAAEFCGVGDEPLVAGVAVVDRGGESVLGAFAVRCGDDDAGEAGAEDSAGVVFCFEVAGLPAAAVDIQNQRERAAIRWFRRVVDADGDIGVDDFVAWKASLVLIIRAYVKLPCPLACLDSWVSRLEFLCHGHQEVVIC